MAKKIELLHTTYGESGNIESQEVVHPLTSPDCIIMENGKTLDEVMGDGIATPTLTHEGTSFKVGVGDSNIEVVDGDVAGMTLKGQSYQNILPKPTTLIMETDEKEFKINDKIDSNIIIDDNIAEIATVKGKTIVNAVQEESASEYVVLGEDLSGQSIVHVKETPTLEGQTLVNIINEPTPMENVNLRSANYTLNAVKPNTDYLVKYEVGGTVQGKLAIGFLVDPSTWTNNLENQERSATVILNSGSEPNYFRIIGVPNVDSFTEDDVQINIIEYQEGMENWDIPYFEGEKYFESNIKGVTLQGQTLVNTIQEPCEDDYVVLGAEDGIEISAETSGYGTIEDTVQGNINGTVLEGMTLINTISNTYDSCHLSVSQEVSMSSEDTTWDSETYRIKAITFTKNMLPNVTYLIKLKVTELTGTDKLGSYVVDMDGNMTYSIANGVLGENNFIYTPTVEIQKIAFYLDDIAGKTATIKEPMVIEYQDGMENWDIPYFEGMQSVKMPVLTTVGKNILNPENYIVSSLTSSTDGIIINILNAEPTDWFSTIYDDLNLHNNTYTISCEVIEGNYLGGNLCIYDENNKNIREFAFKNGSGSVTITSSINKLRLWNAYGTDNCQIRVTITNDGSTEYEPYKSNILTTEKNIFDGILTPDYLTDSTGQPSGLNGSLTHSCYAPSFIPIQANEKFRLRATSDESTTVGDGRVYFYDKDYNYLNVYVTSLEVYTSTYSMDAINIVPNNSNIAYMRVRFFNGLGVQADSVQINKVFP